MCILQQNKLEKRKAEKKENDVHQETRVTKKMEKTPQEKKHSYIDKM